MSNARLSLIIVCIAIVLLGGGLTAFLIFGKPAPDKATDTPFAPNVAVMRVSPENLTLTVEAQGTVEPRRQIDLVAQVGGRVTKVADSFLEGEFFDAGETLVWIEDRDFKNAVTRARAQVASAQQRLALERAEADQAAKDWELLGGQGEPTDLVLRKPQLAEAQANLDSAKAGLADALLNIERTKLSAPFAGRVRTKSVDVGQFVSPGQSVGTVYATDLVEIGLPLTDRQASYVNLPMSPRQQMDPVPVTIRATSTGQSVTWDGVIRRTDGAIDTRSRVIVAIAEVTDPFHLEPSANATDAPLTVGLFVTADIEGKSYRNVFRIPRNALRGENEVVTVTPEEVIAIKTVDVLRTTVDHAFISSGLDAGDMVLLTPLEAPINGMKVQLSNAMKSPRNGGSAAAISLGGAP